MVMIIGNINRRIEISPVNARPTAAEPRPVIGLARNGPSMTS